MSENFKFNQNKKCEYFPCHQVANPDEFNCLFCFCPLYMLKDKCGGNFKYTSGVKDCSDCAIPHAKNGYEFIMSKMAKVTEIGSEHDESKQGKIQDYVIEKFLVYFIMEVSDLDKSRAIMKPVDIYEAANVAGASDFEWHFVEAL